MYSIKNFKKFKGHEGEPCAQGTLHGPAGKVADWSDDSWGGAMRITFVSRTAEAAFLAFAKTYLVGKSDYAGEPYDLATLVGYAPIEAALHDMSVKFEEQAQLLRHTKKGIAYYLEDLAVPEKKSLYVVKAAYTPENVAKLRSKHGAALLEVVNETLSLPFVDGDAFQKAAENKRLRTLCRTHMMFYLKNSDGTLALMKNSTGYSTANATRLKATYPNLAEIVNERFL